MRDGVGVGRDAWKKGAAGLLVRIAGWAPRQARGIGGVEGASEGSGEAGWAEQ